MPLPIAPKKGDPSCDLFRFGPKAAEGESINPSTDLFRFGAKAVEGGSARGEIEEGATSGLVVFFASAPHVDGISST